MTSRERLIDEMALVLLNIAELGDEQACRDALELAAFMPITIELHWQKARDIARKIRADEADLWAAVERDRIDREASELENRIIEHYERKPE